MVSDIITSMPAISRKKALTSGEKGRKRIVAIETGIAMNAENGDDDDIGREGDDGEPVEIKGISGIVPSMALKETIMNKAKAYRFPAGDDRKVVGSCRHRLWFGNKRSRQPGRDEQDCQGPLRKRVERKHRKGQGDAQGG